MEKQLQHIMDVFADVGFPRTLEWPVQVHLCFAPARFAVQHEQFRGSDQLRYEVWVAREEDNSKYMPVYYDATLIRPLELNPQNGCAEQVISLNQQMQLVNWSGLLGKAATATVGDFSDLGLVADIVDNLTALEQHEGGQFFADLLRLRYWTRTPFEHYARCGSGSKGLFEVTQRFHFFSDGQGITLDEAYRFLQHRWLQKKLQDAQKGTKVSPGVKGNKA